jgi:hypothetical protein
MRGIAQSNCLGRPAPPPACNAKGPALTWSERAGPKSEAIRKAAPLGCLNARDERIVDSVGAEGGYLQEGGMRSMVPALILTAANLPFEHVTHRIQCDVLDGITIRIGQFITEALAKFFIHTSFGGCRAMAGCPI